MIPGLTAAVELETSILKLKIITALKSGQEEILSQLIENSPNVLKYRLLLHLAVQIASVQVVQWLVENYASGKADGDSIDVNNGDSNGNTPLHLAALYGRQDIALYLLSLLLINDTLVNNDGKQPVELSRYPETAAAMQVARAQYVEKSASLMKKYLSEQNTRALEQLLSTPRASALLDINGQDPDTGSTVLHDFVRQRNVKMVEFILSHGGDPFRRDVKGVLPIELAKDDNIKKTLKNASKLQSVIGPSSSGIDLPATNVNGTSRRLQEAPSMKGYLKKWTNFTGGYKLRWFALENGVLSYYKRQDDTDRACRGSINMKKAQLHLDSSEKLRFEITTAGSSSKFHLKANHPIETNRWVWALTNAIQYAKDQDKARQHQDQSDHYRHRRNVSASTSVFATLSSRSLAVKNKDDGDESILSDISKISTTASNISKPSMLSTEEDSRSAVENIDTDMDRSGDEYDVDEDAQSDVSYDDPPFENQHVVAEESVRVELSAMSSLINSLSRGKIDVDSLQEGLGVFNQSINTLTGAVNQYFTQSNAREDYYSRKLERARVQQQLWVQNIRDLELEHEKIQGDLHDALRKRKEVAKKLKQVGQTAASPNLQITEELSDGSDDDEFFDVEDENRMEPEPLIEKIEEEKPAMTESQLVKQRIIESQNSYAGYEDLPRETLTTEDNRPQLSLWTIIKNAIGKDITRLTLPVSFNECTNLLQRSAEDMEYTYILDNATASSDPGLRLAYVAAFAGSSYSSTINRIAKPFNPLLGETYEYCRRDKGFRFLAEQVSHHPPVGAAMAESAKWDFYGESLFKPRFNGRSIDVNLLGRWHVALRPDDGSQEELYSFRKLTSSVVGIITGSPVVDNYGDMEVVNHTLGYKCIVKYKARGWRGTNAYELKGTIVNPQGQGEWVVYGRWNSKIYARKIDHVSDIDMTEDELNTILSSAPLKRILLWQAHERPKAPFNLTSFAITLNALPDQLRSWIAPTDTRLRPDQRAMEEGRYSDATDDKHRVEEKQRAARKARELRNEAYEPLWFTKTQHPVTNEIYYKPTGNYWKIRSERKLTGYSQDIF